MAYFNWNMKNILIIFANKGWYPTLWCWVGGSGPPPPPLAETPVNYGYWF